MENNHYGVESSIAGRNQFFMKVYAWMFGGLAISALVAYLFSTVPALYSAFFNFMVTTHGIRNGDYHYCTISTRICNASKL